MCTATWMKGDGFRTFLFTRDEKTSRGIESPPGHRPNSNSPSFLSPLDPDSGGTWIAVNEYGLIAAVLNNYDAGNDASENKSSHNPPISRGTLPLVAVAQKTVNYAAGAIEELNQQSTFKPFLMLLLGTEEEDEGRLLIWDGTQLANKPLSSAKQPITTSSWKGPEVCSFRKELFHKTTGGSTRLDLLLEYHGFLDVKHPAWGPTMIRDDANTRSMSQIRIGTHEVSFRHQLFDRQACAYLEPSEVRLRRKIAGPVSS